VSIKPKKHKDYSNPSFGFVIKDGARSKASCQETTQTWNESRIVKTHLHEMKVCECENDAFPRTKTLKLLSHFGI